ncbi:MAG: M23 family metallopeptidase [Clostridia bacterium]|nr:M23 family metallopeptidase [Clostridia bacterium]
MLKKSTYILLSLLLCVPLVFIVYFSLSINTEKPTNTTLLSLVITNRDGYEFSYSDPEELDLYLAAVSDARKIDRPVRDISSERPTVVTYNELNEKYSYNFYVDNDADECYISDASGTFYRIAPEQAKTISLRKEFAYLCNNYTVPTLKLNTVSGSYVYTANDGYEWKFKQGDGYSDGFLTPTVQNPIINFGASDTLSMEFSNAPDKCEFTVYRGDTSVHFADSVESIAELPQKLSYESDTPLVCEIKAEWLSADDGESYGMATYTAELLYDIPVSYTVVDGKLSPGEFTIVKFKNLNEGQTVTFVSEIQLPPTRVHEVNGKKFAFLPIDLSTKPGQYVINVIAGDKESSFNFTVNNKTFQENQIAIAHGTSAYDTSKAEFDAIVKQVCEQSGKERLWDDGAATGGTYKFANPVPSAETGSPAFGTKIIADTNLRASTPYINTSVVLEAEEGKDVVATATGKIAYVGELAYCGKTVIIDHGCNVLSIYQNLSEVSVKVGDAVAIKSIIGKTGKSGYIFKSGTKFSMVMDGTYINPVSNYTYGIQVS